MGRNKILIKKIQDPKDRRITFNKRKNGLLKKACELAMLCDIKLALAFTDLEGNVIQMFAPDISGLKQIKKNMQNHSVLDLKIEKYPNFFTRDRVKKEKNIDMADYITSDSDEESSGNMNQALRKKVRIEFNLNKEVSTAFQTINETIRNELIQIEGGLEFDRFSHISNTSINKIGSYGGQYSKAFNFQDNQFNEIQTDDFIKDLQNDSIPLRKIPSNQSYFNVQPLSDCLRINSLRMINFYDNDEEIKVEQ